MVAKTDIEVTELKLIYCSCLLDAIRTLQPYHYVRFAGLLR